MSAIVAFGLNDAVSASNIDASYRVLDFLSDVVLPVRASESVLLGVEAEDSRVHSGFEWPLESRITTPSGEAQRLRRLPVPLLWNHISEPHGSESKIRWQLEKGGEISTASLLAKHCKNLLEQLSRTPDPKGTCVCIPSTLPESAQDHLLKEFNVESLPNIKLLWRDIAAIFSAVTRGAFSDVRTETYPLNILVVHVGIDQVECSVRQLTIENFEGKEILVPERHLDTSRICGSFFELVASLLGPFVGLNDLSDNSKWKLVTSSNSFWRVLLGESSIENDLVYSNAWRSVSFTAEGFRKTLKTGLMEASFEGTWLADFVRESRVNRTTVSQNEFTAAKLSAALSHCGQNVDKIILSGRLSTIPVIQDLIQDALGEKFEPIIIDEKGLCDGATEYLRRLHVGEPTFYDHLPPLSLLIAEGIQLKWMELISRGERVQGGEAFRKNISGRIAVDKERDKLEISLQTSRNEPRPIRAGNDVVEDFLNDTALSALTDNAACYIRCLAREIVGQPTPQVLKWLEEDEARKAYHTTLQREIKSPGEWKHDALRTLTFELPHAAHSSIACDLIVEASPASGRTRLTIKTIRSEFARGDFEADYSTMKDSSLLELLETKEETKEKVKTAWPKLQETPVYPNEYRLGDDNSGQKQSVGVKGKRTSVEDYLATAKTKKDYLDKFTEVKREILTASPWQSEFGTRIRLYNERCIAAGSDVAGYISQIAQKLGDDFNSFDEKETQRKIFTQASFLYGNCPSSVKQFAESHLHDFTMSNYHHFFQPSCRIAVTGIEIERNIRALFAWARFNENRGKEPLNCNGILGLLFLLRFREGTERHISLEEAHQLSNWLVDAIENEIKKYNFKKKFCQAVLTLLYLLRFRRKDSTFLAPETPQAEQLIARLTKIAGTGGKRSSDHKVKAAFQKAEADVQSIIKFIQYKPDHSLVATLSREVDEGDEDHD